MAVTEKIVGVESTEKRSQELASLMTSDLANVSSMSIKFPYSIS